MISKKKILYLGVGLIGAYFLFPHAQTMLEYVKSKIKKKSTDTPDKDTSEGIKMDVPCNCITTPCNCKK